MADHLYKYSDSDPPIIVNRESCDAIFIYAGCC